MDNTCEKCRYWKAGGNATYVGLCRRFPKPHMKRPTDWCGEWKRVRKSVSAIQPEFDEPAAPSRQWCDQCERRVTNSDISKCESRFCSLKGTTR